MWLAITTVVSATIPQNIGQNLVKVSGGQFGGEASRDSEGRRKRPESNYVA
jgi:hypothetical protein